MGGSLGVGVGPGWLGQLCVVWLGWLGGSAPVVAPAFAWGPRARDLDDWLGVGSVTGMAVGFDGLAPWWFGHLTGDLRVRLVVQFSRQRTVMG